MHNEGAVSEAAFPRSQERDCGYGVDHAMTEEYEDWKVTPVEEWDDWNEHDIPAWSLGRLIEMLPSPIQPKEELPSYSGCAYLNLAQIAVWYDYTDYDMDDRTLISWSGNGFFSAVVEAIKWLIKEGYFNKEYLV